MRLLEDEALELGVVGEGLLLPSEEAHSQGQEAHTKYVPFLPVLAGCLPLLPELRKPLWSDVLEALSVPGRFSVLFGLLKGELVVGGQEKELSVGQEVLPLLVDQQALGPDCSMLDVVVVQEVEGPYQVVDHSEDLDFLEVAVDHLSLLGWQPVDLLVAAQPHLLRLPNRIRSQPSPELLERGEAGVKDAEEAVFWPEVLEGQQNAGAFIPRAVERHWLVAEGIRVARLRLLSQHAAVVYLH